MAMPSDTSALLPAWTFSLPQLVGNDKAMLSGLLLGLLFGRWQIGFTEKCLPLIERCISICLKVFLWVIPFFILGFVVKMTHDKVMSYIFKRYTFVFVLVACAVFLYIGFIYLCANRFNLADGIRCLKNMLPAAIAGFGSMSSAAAMPLTILGTEKNSSNKDLARSIIPATVNVHLIGDCFAIPIFAFAVLKNFGHIEPAFLDYLIFAGYFILAKFSVAAVPGGGILVMLPILESTLGFNGEMLSLITALYILFDPIITSANVLGNGGFALVLEKASGSSAELTRST
jgi:Na+/H+-dicarboxylate symporter